jgi:carbamoyl-phosphate synthase large subunit
MNQQKLLIVGASIGQVPLLLKAKERGIHVTVVSIPGNYACFELADDIIYADVFDRDLVVEEAKKRGITAVLSDQNDLMVPTVAYVAEKLGLPGNRFDTVMTYCNKNCFRDACDKAGVPCPKHIAITSLDDDLSVFGGVFPLMVKPADSQSSIGVKKVNNQEELQGALQFALEKSPTHNAIVEEFFEGREVVCEGFIDNGKYYPLQFADRRYFDLKGVLIPSQTIFPSILDKEIQRRIVGYEQALSSSTKPAFAITHSEYLINETTGEVRIVESALRGGGVYISSDLIPMATGIDINDVLLDKALGVEVDVNSVFAKRNDKAAAYVCFYLPEGTIQSIEGIDEIKALPFVRKTYIDDLTVGQQTMPPNYKGARKGPILVQGENRDNLEKNIIEVQNTLKSIVKTTNDDLRSICWS